MAKRTRKPATSARGIEPSEALRGKVPGAIEALEEGIERAGGCAIARYRDPLGGHWLVLALLPIDKVQATPYQRELSPSHVKRLAEAMPKVGRYLDPIVAVPAAEGGYWTPNGMHRLEAMRALGARAISALVVPEQDVAMKILALNTERAHGLRDRSLEVVRMARALASADGGRVEKTYADTFEEPAWLTLGLCYEARPRFAGNAYLPLVRRCEAFLDVPLAEAIRLRQQRAALVLALDDVVGGVIEALQQRGLRSPYLRAFVMARATNRPGKTGPRATRAAARPFEPELLAAIEAVKRMDLSRIRRQDVSALPGGAAMDELGPTA